MKAETQLQLDLERKLRLVENRGVLWHHCAQPQHCRGPGGWPDTLAVSTHGLLIYEIKTDTGETSPEQDKWLWTLERALITSRTLVTVRRPDLQRDRVTEELRWLAGDR